MSQQSLFDPPRIAPTWTGCELAGLLRLPGVGPGRALEIARASGSRTHWDVEALRRLGTWAKDLPASPPPVVEPAGDAMPIGFFDDAFPTLLRQLKSRPPAVLWVRGILPKGEKTLAIVGTRNPDQYAIKVARRIATAVADAGFVVVSGLARGCDAIAQEACLDAGGSTVAYLGGSLTNPQPLSSKEIAYRILDGGGALVTEVEPEVEVRPNQLVDRNRLQSGSSRATIVIQTGIPGGTLHTARFTVEQERKLAVVRPPTPNAPGWEGNEALLADQPFPMQVLRVTGRQADVLKRKVPFADISLSDPENLDELFREFA